MSNTKLLIETPDGPDGRAQYWKMGDKSYQTLLLIGNRHKKWDKLTFTDISKGYDRFCEVAKDAGHPSSSTFNFHPEAQSLQNNTDGEKTGTDLFGG